MTSIFDNTKSLLLAGLAIRLVLVIYGEIQDYYSDIKYSDIDYKVYTDGGKYVLEGKSPYQRHTFRYTPLMAYLGALNLVLVPWFCKALFSFFDVAVAYIITLLLKDSTLKNRNILMCIWLFNPLTIAIPTRGSSDPIICLLVISVFYFLKNKNFTFAAICYGFAVHFRIYPIIYGVIFLKMIYEKTNSLKAIIKFGIISGGLFFVLLAWGYSQYGWEFLYEGYLYHLTRKDNRHNFSIYFYAMYLGFSQIHGILSVALFIPQLLLVSLSSFLLKEEVAMFTATFVFVIFNKVCTAQYFVWYLCLLPLVLAKNRLFLEKSQWKKLAGLWIFWLAMELLWNLAAHRLEHLGIGNFLEIWVTCIAFFFANILILKEILLGVMKDEKVLENNKDESKIKSRKDKKPKKDQKQKND